ncbi:transporter, major facilitator family protein [Rhodococcus erythropolis SK121]|nr:transporter, major facilitator family protein [Rhodococcus erythropolis SK121]
MSSPDLTKASAMELSIGHRASRPAPAQLGGRALFLLLILDLSYFINAMDRQVFAVLLPDIKVAFGLTGGQAGIIATIFTLGMGLAGIPAGYLADRFGRRKIILISLVIFSVSCALQAVAVGIIDMTLWRVLSGVGEGMQNAALFAAVGAFFSRNRGFAIGSINAAFGVGAFTGPLLGGAILSATGDWRMPLFVFGGIGLVILLMVLVLVPQSVTEVGRNQERNTSPSSVTTNAGTNFLNRRVVCAGFAAAAGGFTIYGYLGLYPTYLRDAHGFTASQAGWAASMFGIGALGALVGGAIADRVDQRLLNVAGFVGIMVLGAAIFGFTTPLAVQMTLSLLLGVAFTGIVYTNTSTLMQRSVDAKYVGRVSGLFVAAMYIPASISGYFFAHMRDIFGWQTAGIIQLTVIPIIGLIAMAAMGKTPARTNP